MSEIAIQMWTVRDEAERSLPGTLARLSGIGYRAVETAGLYGLSPREVAQLLEDHGLALASAHQGVPDRENEAETFDRLAELGATMCFSSLHEEHWISDDALKEAVDKLNAAAEAASRWGIRMGYHNHWWEFAHHIGDRPAYDRFLEIVDPRVLLEVDTYWVEVGGSSAPDLLGRIHSRVPCVHIKDGPGDQGSANVAVGDGTLDIPAILEASAGASWEIVEMDSCDGDVWAAIERSLQYLQARRTSP
jgi:sugar phosphate isomerase/epimerase